MEKPKKNKFKARKLDKSKEISKQKGAENLDKISSNLDEDSDKGVSDIIPNQKQEKSFLKLPEQENIAPQRNEAKQPENNGDSLKSGIQKKNQSQESEKGVKVLKGEQGRMNDNGMNAMDRNMDLKRFDEYYKGKINKELDMFNYQKPRICSVKYQVDMSSDHLLDSEIKDKGKYHYLYLP